MKIAIVGAGISGLTCAYLLHRKHDITVFESNNYAGGHANTVDIRTGSKTVPVDTGFLVFNERNYPTLCRLFDEVGVPSHASDMSFSVHCEASAREWNGTSLNQVFAQRTNLVRWSHWRMLADIMRFHREAPAALAHLDDCTSVATWLKQHNYSKTFERHYLLPLGASLWSCSASCFADFPMRFAIEFLNNHRMLQVDGRPQWRTVSGGSREYVKRMTAHFSDALHISKAVRSVKRTAQGVDVHLRDGAIERFDEVILACHADQALRMVASPDDTEQALLKQFPYQPNIAVLHKDVTMLPKRRRAWGSWNFRIPAGEAENATVTYNLNMLQGLECDDVWCVSLNPGDSVNSADIARTFRYDHPLFTSGRSEAQRRHHELIRRGGISYCGAYWGFGFHEDGARSAMHVCEAYAAELARAA